MSYALRRHSDGKVITVHTASAANDLVANGVAEWLPLLTPSKPARNRTGKPEAVLTAEQLKAVKGEPTN